MCMNLAKASPPSRDKLMTSKSKLETISQRNSHLFDKSLVLTESPVGSLRYESIRATMNASESNQNSSLLILHL
ncbi:unnamed protein product [Arabidopsis thaliana]|uniref:Uncharacterized protein n=1 Tax=Arabidopsis thaliana TaxID=3702 RepID=A0A5S9X278_ARATH|nr:unnamed protein product [Arabidopsis thaliana]